MRKLLRSILILGGIISIFYVITVAVLFGEQRSMLYAGAGVRCPSDVPRGYRTVQIAPADGERISGLYRPATSGHKTILFFHGNADSARTGIDLFAPLTADGDGALLVEYRGYCGNSGTPDEQGLYRDGEAAVQWLGKAGIDPSQMIVAGYSLGTGVATKVAADHRPEALILVAAYTSIADVGADHFAWAPARMLTRDRFPSIERIGRVHAPILLVHGADDTLVLADHARALAKRAEKATLVIVPGEGHMVGFSPDVAPLIARWALHL